MSGGFRTIKLGELVRQRTYFAAAKFYIPCPEAISRVKKTLQRIVNIARTVLHCLTPCLRGSD